MTKPDARGLESLQPLLARAEDRRPVNRSLPLHSLFEEPQPEACASAPVELDHPGGDPGDLRAQRWGLVVPEGPRGEELLGWIEPLRAVREAEQGGAPVPIYRVAPGVTGPQALGWKRDVFQRSAREPELPRYLLILGDLDEVALELQQALASDRCVGRLAFDSGADFEAYVAKVLAWEGKPSAETRARALFYAVRDGTGATERSYEHLIAPALAQCRELEEMGSFPASEIRELSEPARWSLDRLLAPAAESLPGVLMTLGHGLGPPGSGKWASEQEQRASQGALCVNGELLTGKDLRSRAFLPGGVWMSVACFSAGTPSRSLYHHWLSRVLEAQGSSTDAEALLPGISATVKRPFVAALPKAALANPQGPLAVIGHVDLAWSRSFHDEVGRSHAALFVSVLRSWMQGERVGIGAGVLARSSAERSVELAMLYDREEANSRRGEAQEAWRMERGSLWMARNDLAAYVLLGDPAVRLPLAGRRTAAAPGRAAPAPAARAAPAPSPALDSEGSERLVIEALGGANLAELSARNGVPAEELLRWTEAYRLAGRAALRRLLAEEDRK